MRPDEPPLRRALAALRDADAVIVVPPFAELGWPALGPHVLQAVAANEGLRVRVCYANLLFAEVIGRQRYEDLSDSRRGQRLGERVFASAAFDLPRLGCHEARTLTSDMDAEGEDHRLEYLLSIAKIAERFCEGFARVFAEIGVPVVGCTTTFEQTLPALAILNSIKRQSPRVTTLLGGANCDGAMAVGLASVASMADHIFSGESETTFCNFLLSRRACQGARAQRIISGQPCPDLSSLPCPDFNDYFLHRALHQGELPEPWLVYETSRGCWWGQKHHCTFCGLNGSEMAFRAKAPEVALSDIRELVGRFGVSRICMADNIMPAQYHQTLIPQLERLEPKVTLFYELKANLSLRQVQRLSRAGIAIAQPGIESLSTAVLKRIDKGVSAPQNIALLRYARMCDLELRWNMLYAIPGDSRDDYLEMIEFLPAISHLQPPVGVSLLRIDRFSPYFDQSARFGISNVTPDSAYEDIYPPGTDVSQIAYHFCADYPSGSRSDHELYARLANQTAAWRECWAPARDEIPLLAIAPIGVELYLLVDTRPGFGPAVEFIDPDRAAAALAGGGTDESRAWALENRYALEVDGRFVPLATSDCEVVEGLTAAWKSCSRLECEVLSG